MVIKERAKRQLWKLRDDDSVMNPDESDEVFRMDTERLQDPENRGCGKGQ